MLYIKNCGVGNLIELYASNAGANFLAEMSHTTNYVIQTTYLGYYPFNQDSLDKCLIGWKIEPKVCNVLNFVPKAFSNPDLAIYNSSDFKYFRWCGAQRYVHQDLGPDMIIGASKTGTTSSELSPIHAPGWHQCRCGFRNQDISISAIIAGKYVCYQCRNIWRK